MAAKNLTDTAVKAAKPTPGAKSADAIKDGMTPGLYLMVQPTGSKSWVYQYRRPSDQKQAKMSLGSYPAFSLTMARSWAGEQEALRARGIDPKLEKVRLKEEAKAVEDAKAANDTQTLQWFWDTYYLPDHVETLKQPHAEKLYWSRYLSEIADLPLTQIDHRVLDRLLDKAKARSPHQGYKFAGFLKTLWKRMVSEYRYKVVNQEDAARYLGAKNTIGTVERYLDERELGYVIAVIDRYATAEKPSNHRSFALGLRLILATGCRLEEAMTATWDQFDLDEGSWTQPGPSTKNGRPNYLLLQQPIVDWLRALREANPKATFVFQQAKADKALNAFSKSTHLLFRETEHLAKADGFAMEGWSAHDFRRTITTTFQRLHHPGTINRVVTDEVTEALLNHVERTTTVGSRKNYNKHNYMHEKAYALRVWQEVLDKAKADEDVRAAKRGQLDPIKRTSKVRKAAKISVSHV
ncbi:hypothetical protein ASE85_03410 [Sphingobium sp. Leaf26]|uniref:tyrosine-type recombinase/integrase n=1 Tax=Sphingobium sp. Leaf26 TaxID=1735693 RepID=UPI0006F8BC57|nr:integrase arm-type DNA-binding domain-containing protein [Sphingobium sp. Leaf26]KQN09992.1 hypothetical protein ASE85_03410 [Sphingobium sp. Leaf26]